MTILFLICSLLVLLYVWLMLLYRRGWLLQPYFALPPLFQPVTRITVIVPARNEEENIGACLDALLAQHYPAYLFEIIVVDDHSTDDTAGVVAGYAHRGVICMSLARYMGREDSHNAYKKMAIKAAVEVSSGELIVTTDADCIAPNTWLMHLAAAYERDAPAMIVAPVIYTASHRTVELFQLIDFMSMQGITAAAHALGLGGMSNGANLAFSKAAFQEADGYEGTMHLASGDDYLLLMKIRKLPGATVSYLKSPLAAVTTRPQQGWRTFLMQRIRWASKSGKYDDSRLTGILILVYIFNLMLLATGIAGIFLPSFLLFFVTALVAKIAVEYIFLRPVAAFFNASWVLVWLPILQPLHITYIVLAGFLGFGGHYEWKGRKVT